MWRRPDSAWRQQITRERKWMRRESPVYRRRHSGPYQSRPGGGRVPAEKGAGRPNSLRGQQGRHGGALGTPGGVRDQNRAHLRFSAEADPQKSVAQRPDGGAGVHCYGRGQEDSPGICPRRVRGDGGLCVRPGHSGGGEAGHPLCGARVQRLSRRDHPHAGQVCKDGDVGGWAWTTGLWCSPSGAAWALPL